MDKMKYFFLALILSHIYFYSAYAVVSPDYDGIVVLKDIGTDTPYANEEENPQIIDDAIRRNGRLLEIQYHQKAFTASGTATSADTYLVGSSTGNILITIPSASTVASTTTTKLYVVKNNSTGTITLSNTLDGVGSPTVSAGNSITMFSDGVRWYEDKPNTSGQASFASNANALDGLDSTYFLDASNLNAGSIPLARIPTTLTGKDADTVDTIEGASIVQTSRTISTTAPLAGGGALSGDLTLSMPTATVSQGGYISSADYNTFNNQVDSWVCEGTTGTRTLNLVEGVGIGLIPTVGPDGIGTITVNAVGTASVAGWTDTGTQTVSLEGQPVLINGTTTIDSPYGLISGYGSITSLTNTSISATTANITGTATIQNGSITTFTGGTINTTALIVNGTVTADNLVIKNIYGTMSVYGEVYRTGSKTCASGTWTPVEMNTQLTLYGCTHTTSGTNSCRIQVNESGLYVVKAMSHTRNGGGSIGMRLMKNDITEIPDSFVQNYQNFGDTNTSLILSTECMVRLAANDKVSMQVAHNSSDTTIIDYHIVPNMPSPTNRILSKLFLYKIAP